jgi:molecular chaperone GrpE
MAQEPNELEKLTEELETAKAKCEEYLNGWKRERADFLNHKKEEMERIGIIIKYANEELILKILPILDNLCLATSHIKDEGVLQIKKQMEDFLKKEGIEHIEVLGNPFDPNTMEAVGDVPTSAPSSDGATTAVVEIQRGYTMHGKLLRPAKVRVTK